MDRIYANVLKDKISTRESSDHGNRINNNNKSDLLNLGVKTFDIKDIITDGFCS